MFFSPQKSSEMYLSSRQACHGKPEDFGQLCCFPSGAWEQPFHQELDSSHCVSLPLCLRRTRCWDLMFGMKYSPCVRTPFPSSNATCRPCRSCWGTVAPKYGSSFLERITFFLDREASNHEGALIPVVLQERESAMMGLIAEKCTFLGLNSYGS